MDIQKAEALVLEIEKAQYNCQAIALMRARDKAIIERIIFIFDSHSAFDPHGIDHGDGTHDGIIKCTNELRAELEAFKRELD